MNVETIVDGHTVSTLVTRPPTLCLQHDNTRALLDRALGATAQLVACLWPSQTSKAQRTQIAHQRPSQAHFNRPLFFGKK